MEQTCAKTTRRVSGNDRNSCAVKNDFANPTSEPMRRAEMRLATNLYWRADWRLASRATVLAPDILDPCQVTLLRVDATPTVKRRYSLEARHSRRHEGGPR